MLTFFPSISLPLAHLQLFIKQFAANWRFCIEQNFILFFFSTRYEKQLRWKIIFNSMSEQNYHNAGALSFIPGNLIANSFHSTLNRHLLGFIIFWIIQNYLLRIKIVVEKLPWWWRWLPLLWHIKCNWKLSELKHFMNVWWLWNFRKIFVKWLKKISWNFCMKQGVDDMNKNLHHSLTDKNFWNF